MPKLTRLLISAAFALGSLPATAATLTVEITDISQARGTLNIALYDSEQTFRKTQARGVRVPAKADTVSVEIADLAAGHYAVLVFHDLNDNHQLDTNLLGMPKEPWGGSLQGRTVFGTPAWKDVQFELPGAGAPILVRLND
ncbi:MAG: DUF2141 domain-containing protein [Burkholderiaceae bacterium]